MSIPGFYWKLVSGTEEGKVFEVLRRLQGIGISALRSVDEDEPATWIVWNEGSSAPAGASLATAPACSA